MADDFKANARTTGTVEVGGSATGEIGTRNDVDWFAVELVAGQTYVIDLEGAPTGGGTLGRRDAARALRRRGQPHRRHPRPRRRRGRQRAPDLHRDGERDPLHRRVQPGRGDTGSYTVRVAGAGTRQCEGAPMSALRSRNPESDEGDERNTISVDKSTQRIGNILNNEATGCRVRKAQGDPPTEGTGSGTGCIRRSPCEG